LDDVLRLGVVVQQAARELREEGAMLEEALRVHRMQESRREARIRFYTRGRMSFSFFILGFLVLPDLLWWRWADRRLSGVRWGRWPPFS
jgi:hypothetical protein